MNQLTTPIFMSPKTSRILSAIMFQVTSRPSIETIGVKAYRKLLEKSARVFKHDPLIREEPVEINGIQALWLIPPGCDEKRMVVYIHGGGFIAGSINSHKDLASRIATESCSKLLIFNYRLAPEYPFPAGLNDVCSVYNWVVDTFSKTHSINLAGDSAGGGLAVSLIGDLMAKSRPLPDSIVLMSPWVDLECKSASFESNENKDFMLTRHTLMTTAGYYTDQELSHPLISPINNRFDTMPPTLIQVGANEVLLEDSNLLAEKIRKENRNVELEVWDGMFHVWQYFSKYLSEGKEAVTRLGEFIQKHSDTTRILKTGN